MRVAPALYSFPTHRVAAIDALRHHCWRPTVWRKAALGVGAVIGALSGCSSDKPKSAPPDASVTNETSTNSESTTSTSTATMTQVSPVGDGGPPLLGAPCNGNSEYCSKHYDDFCQAATHDSAANSPDYWQYPVQSASISMQLNSSIGALMLSVYEDGGVLSVCRGDCAEGSSALGSVLSAVKEFLDANPRIIVTLLIDSTVASSRLQREFEAQGLDRLARAQAENDAWPTLGQLIDSGQRLVVFSNAPSPGVAWLLPRDVWIWETASDWASLTSMKCNAVVGDRSRPLALVHHNLVGPSDAGFQQPSVTLATTANAFGIVTARLQACESQMNRVPTFVAVDFADVGDVVGATQVINGVRPAP